MNKDEVYRRLEELTTEHPDENDYFGLSSILRSSYASNSQYDILKEHLKELLSKGRIKRIRAVNNSTSNHYYRAIIEE